MKITPVGLETVVSLIFFPLYHKSVKEVSTFCACKVIVEDIHKNTQHMQLISGCNDLKGIIIVATGARQSLYLITFFLVGDYEAEHVQEIGGSDHGAYYKFKKPGGWREENSYDYFTLFTASGFVSEGLIA